MKREINCDECAASWRSHAGVRRDDDPLWVAERYAMEETLTQVRGALRGSCMCDECGRVLERGEQATATTISHKHSPYQPWEDEYLDTDDRHPSNKLSGYTWTREP